VGTLLERLHRAGVAIAIAVSPGCAPTIVDPAASSAGGGGATATSASGSGGAAVTSASGSGGGAVTSTTGSGGCALDQKTCAGGCVPVDDPAFGCAAAGCEPCSFANATAVCAGGACVFGACDPGFEDCDGDAPNGCEVALLDDPANCGACGHLCQGFNGTAGCDGGACTVVACYLGFVDCDGDASNGCEAQLIDDPKNCGGCGLACAPGDPCCAGACGIFGPKGKADCDGDCTNGAETTLGTTTDCAFCGDACDSTNAIVTCVLGASDAENTCAIMACDPGYGDCDANPANGCEAATSSDPSHCGGCGLACAPGESCSSGTCL
jgi:hypothetical protein